MPRPGSAAPFLKWAGGKRQLLEQLARFIPELTPAATYHEPFLGGGALFFHLQPRRALLSDINEELVECFQVVRDDVDALIEALLPCKNEPEFYYEMRARDPATLTAVGRAARTIYLNRTCFNGLYRVNRAGRFNVPFGRYANPTLCDETGLRTASRALAGAKLEVRPFRSVLERARPGDFVYFDPPYQPLSVTSSFTAYTRHPFGDREQQELASIFARLVKLGCRVMLSNSDTDRIRSLYSAFRIEQVLANRAINSKAAGRGKIAELVILGGFD